MPAVFWISKSESYHVIYNNTTIVDCFSDTTCTELYVLITITKQTHKFIVMSLFNLANRSHCKNIVRTIKVKAAGVNWVDYDTARHLRVMSFTGTKVRVRCLVRPIKREDAIGSVTIGRAKIERKPACRDICLL